MFVSMADLQYSFLEMSLPDFGIRIILASYNKLEFSASFFWKIAENWHHFFLTCLVEFTGKPIKASCVLFRNVINCGFNFFN